VSSLPQNALSMDAQAAKVSLHGMATDGNRHPWGHHEDAEAEAVSGHRRLVDPKLNKGLAFDQEERSALRVHGMLPYAIENLELQMAREIAQVRRKADPIDKYEYLMGLLDRNATLFYHVLENNVKELMPVVYTPTVGQACREYSMRWSSPRGLYVTIYDKGSVRQIINNWPEEKVSVIVFTDGERILGLGDLGVNGMGIPVGKLQLYSVCAGINPRECLPVCIDVGTNNESLLDDPLYQGIRDYRVRGKDFEELIEEFMSEVVHRWGRTTLMQFEDFGNSTAFGLLENARKRYTTFNDDIQGTAAVTLAGIIASLSETAFAGGAETLGDHTYVFLGAGEAGTGIANLIAFAIQEESEGLKTLEEARSQIWLVDSKGLITADRDMDALQHHKRDFAHELTDVHMSRLSAAGIDISSGSDVKDLITAVRALEPSVLIGVSAIPNTFTQEVCEAVASYHKVPLIFALSNPTSQAECTAYQAYTWTDGRCIFASGSPFGVVDVELKDGTKRTFEPGQGNNSYIFPGLGLGVIAAKCKTIPDELLYVTAVTLAEQVLESDRERGSMYPELGLIRDVSMHIAVAVAKRARSLEISSVAEPPSDWLEHIQGMMHVSQYDDFFGRSEEN